MSRDLIKQLQKAQRRLSDAGNLGREERLSIAALIGEARTALSGDAAMKKDAHHG